MKKKKPSKSPQIDENELLKVIDIIAKKLAYKFKFGYHDIEDMKQQISIFAIEGLKSYDHKRPLENFLWTHVRNRLFNYKRDNYQRPDKPCYSCPLYDKALTLCTKYSNKNDCELYNKWLNRNQNKKNLMHLKTVDEVKDFANIFLDSEKSPDQTEIIEIIEQNLSGEYRVIYLKIKHGSKVNKADKDKLILKIREILCLKNEDN